MKMDSGKKIKEIKLSKKRNGYGDVSSYSINIGASEAKEVGFVNSDGEIMPLEKIIDTDNQQIVLRKK